MNRALKLLRILTIAGCMLPAAGIYGKHTTVASETDHKAIVKKSTESTSESKPAADAPTREVKEPMTTFTPFAQLDEVEFNDEIMLDVAKVDELIIPMNDIEWHKLVMNEVYGDINGFRVTFEEQDKVVEKGGFPTYGEITYESLQKILDELNLTKKDVFVDLGCGVGKCVTQVYLNTDVKKSVGVELCETRYWNALEIKERLKEREMLDRRKIIFYNDNMLDMDYKDATVVYTCSTCFSHELMLGLTKKLSKLKKGLRVLTLKELPAYKEYGFKLVKEYNLPMTWSPDGSPVYMYELVG